MTAPSLADQAVAALAAVSVMTDSVTNDHPERHTIREMKRTAEDILESAIRHARGIARMAEQLQRDMRDKDGTR